MRPIAAVCLSSVALWLASPAISQVTINRYDTCLSVANDSPEAALEIARSMEVDGEVDAGTHCRAVALFRQGANDQAGNLFGQLAGDASDPVIKAQLLTQAATALMAQGDALGAIDRAVQATSANPSDAEPWLIIAEAQSTREEHGEALTALAFAQSLLPPERQVDLLVMRAALQRRSDDAASARASLIEALQTEPGYPAALLELGVLFFELSDDPNAALVWGDLIDLHPATPEALQAERYLTRLKELTDK